MEDKEMNELVEEIEELEDELVEEQPTQEESEELSEAVIDELQSRKLLLEGEIAMLEGELEKKREETDRKAREYAEFRELFPGVDTDELAPEVLASVEAGVPLTAAYALYEKRIAVRNAVAAAHNKATKQGGFGSVGKGSESEYYTPDEVRAMSRSEVKQNYQKILRSMQNWH